MNEIKKLRCKKEYGAWFYTTTRPDIYNELDAPTYDLYDHEGYYIATFGCYNDMRYYVETGIIL